MYNTLPVTMTIKKKHCSVLSNLIMLAEVDCKLKIEMDFFKVENSIIPLRSKRLGEFIKNGHKKFHPPV